MTVSFTRLGYKINNDKVATGYPVLLHVEAFSVRV